MKSEGSQGSQTCYRYRFAIIDSLTGWETRGYCEDYEYHYYNDGEVCLVSFYGVTFVDKNSEPDYDIYEVGFSDLLWIRKERVMDSSPQERISQKAGVKLRNE